MTTTRVGCYAELPCTLHEEEVRERALRLSITDVKRISAAEITLIEDGTAREVEA